MQPEKRCINNVTKETVDKKAFERFFQEHYLKAYFLALRITQNAEASKDIVAESFELIWKNSQDNSVDNLYSYLFTIIRHQCTDFLRKKKVRDLYAESYLHTAERTSSNEEDTKELRISFIMSVMDELPPRTMEIMKACYVEHKKYKEVAERLGVTEHTIKKHIIKGLKYLRQRCKEANL